MVGMADQAPETFTVPLSGRDIEFKFVTIGQNMILQRLTRSVQKQVESAPMEEVPGLWNNLVQATLDVIDTRFVRDEDRDFVTAEMLAGRIDFEDLKHVLANGKRETEAPPDDADVQLKVPRKKAAAKKAAAAKKTTTPRARR